MTEPETARELGFFTPSVADFDDVVDGWPVAYHNTDDGSEAIVIPARVGAEQAASVFGKHAEATGSPIGGRPGEVRHGWARFSREPFGAWSMVWLDDAASPGAVPVTYLEI